MTTSPRKRARSARLIPAMLAVVAMAVALLAPLPAAADSPVCLVPTTGPLPPGCVATLSFGQQPTETTAGQVITPAVTVIARDSSGNAAPFTNVTVGLGRNPGAARLHGTLTVTSDASGVATFSDLIVDKAATGYTLVATAGSSPLSPKPSATSAQFNVTGIAINCTTSPCTAQTGNLVLGPSKQDSTMGKVSVPVGACASTECFLSLDESPGAFCSGSCIGNALLVAPPSNANGTMTVDVAYDKSIARGTGVANFRVFKEADDGSISEIFNCPQVPPTASQIPCITKRNRTGVGDLVFTLVMDPVDPRIGTGIIQT